MKDDGKPSGMACCEACGTAVPAYDIVSYGSIEQGFRELCNLCFNAEVAQTRVWTASRMFASILRPDGSSRRGLVRYRSRSRCGRRKVAAAFDPKLSPDGQPGFAREDKG